MAWRNQVHSLLETTLNTRDLGGYPTATGVCTRWGSLLRSDVMKRASEGDIALLRKMGISTVIDMRTGKDAVKSPCSLAAAEGFSYRNFPVEEGSGVPESPDAVAESYVKIAGAKNMGKVFSAIAQAPQGVLFHCTAGKDRTGVVSAILLLLAGVKEADIVWDYMVTKSCNEPRFALLREKFPDLDMTVVIPQERYLEEFLAQFQKAYGTAGRYLQTLGLTAEQIQHIKAKLVQ